MAFRINSISTTFHSNDNKGQTENNIYLLWLLFIYAYLHIVLPFNVYIVLPFYILSGVAKAWSTSPHPICDLCLSISDYYNVILQGLNMSLPALKASLLALKFHAVHSASCLLPPLALYLCFPHKRNLSGFPVTPSQVAVLKSNRISGSRWDT